MICRTAIRFSLATIMQSIFNILQVVSLKDNLNFVIKFGCHGTTSVYNLTVAQGQSSSHNMWIEAGPTDHISMIIAGWMVCKFL